uniref:Uncharacterized protein n=1 Tax=Siphoviridae sp. ctUi914 TaxID=2825529 RepID=A0A8S5TXD3_9CAUD|nr:MAG TPA: hypothetical protein [Siphoviridae sp. ctUi914]
MNAGAFFMLIFERTVIRIGNLQRIVQIQR